MKMIFIFAFAFFFGCDANNSSSKVQQKTLQKSKTKPKQTKITKAKAKPKQTKITRTNWSEISKTKILFKMEIQHSHIETKKIPITIWFKNPTKNKITFRALMRYYSPHGDFSVEDANGKKYISVRCLKKHAYEKVIYQPEEMQKFQFNLLHLPCTTQPSLNPGKYFVKFQNQKLEINVK